MEDHKYYLSQKKTSKCERTYWKDAMGTWRPPFALIRTLTTHPDELVHWSLNIYAILMDGIKTTVEHLLYLFFYVL